VKFIEREGYPEQWFIPFPDRAFHQSRSGFVLQELRRRNIHSFLLVTSDYHSARAARIFLAMERAMGYQPQMRVVTAPDEFFRAIPGGAIGSAENGVLRVVENYCLGAGEIKARH